MHHALYRHSYADGYISAYITRVGSQMTKSSPEEI